jgi:hypothetical protein
MITYEGLSDSHSHRVFVRTTLSKRDPKRDLSGLGACAGEAALHRALRSSCRASTETDNKSASHAYV